MSGLFYNFGKMLGPQVRKAKWAWLSATGSEADAIAAEYEVGRDLAAAIRRQLMVETEPKVIELLNKVGTELSSRIANKRRKFSFEAVKNGAPNAFALPGGFVFITRSLLELCNWDQQAVAFILGHEMSHVIRGHAMNRILSNSAISLGASAAPVRGLIGGLLRTAGIKFFESAYSQDMELEADTLGTLLVDAAGYDPRVVIPLLSRLAKLNRVSNENDFSSYFSTHPAFELRMQTVSHVLDHLTQK